MDVTDLRVIATVVSFIVFIVIVGWAYSSRNKDRFEEAQNLPLENED